MWSDEPPNDDPKQPLGTDYRTLLTILHAAYNSGSSGGTEMLHIGGFVPWAYKYVKEGRCGEKCKHGGVETEWATVCVTSAFNAYVDAVRMPLAPLIATSRLTATDSAPGCMLHRIIFQRCLVATCSAPCSATSTNIVSTIIERTQSPWIRQ